MYASVFHVYLGSGTSIRDRGRSARDLAAVLGAVPGFIAFLAFEAMDSTVAGLCICLDCTALDLAHQVAEAWQREKAGRDEGAITPLAMGKVIVQRGF